MRNSGRLHIIGLDLLRLLAATLVMVYHLGFWHWTRGQAFEGMHLAVPQDAPPSLVGIHSVLHFGWVGVEIFFVISGFVIAWSAVGASPESFLRSRVLRLVPVNIIAAAMYYVYFELSGVSIGRNLTFTFLQTLVFWPFSALDTVWWTLGVEIDFYLLVLFLIKLDKLDFIEHLMVVMGVLSGLFWLVTLSVNSLPSENWALLANVQWFFGKLQAARLLQLFLVQHACLFGLGVLMWKVIDRGLTRRRAIAICAILACCVLEIVGQNGIISRICGLTLSPLPAIACWLGFIVLFAASAYYNAEIYHFLKSKAVAMRIVGALTYPLYLIHNLVGGIVVVLLLPSLGAVSIPIAIAACIAVSWLITVSPEPKLRAVLRNAWQRTLHRQEERTS